MQQAEHIPDSERYRDKIATVDEHGKRVWLYPKKPKGFYTNIRNYVSWVLLAFLFGIPFIKVNGDPLLLFNILERRFIIFGLNFAPQDFYLFVLAMLIFIVFIVLFTVVFGRLFCGWVCPQTIFMEMVYRKIEYFIEGDANAQRRLNKAPWTQDKILKKTAKHVIFFAIAVLVSNTFLAYIIGIDEVKKIILEPISQHMIGFIAMVVFSFAFYGVFAWMREQVCIAVCPYGRLQSVMLDQNSIVVSYDFQRGEPRGKMRKQKNPIAEIQKQVLGDCIDCKLCVQVCPTGIDIRDGTQLECVNCTACIDACDEVMEKVDRPTGLIRYDSYNGIVEGGKRKIFTPRVIAYSSVLIILLAVEVFLLAGRSDVETLLLRTPGMLFQETKDGYISNLYNYQIFNKTNEVFPIEFKIVKPESGARVRLVGQNPTALGGIMTEGAMFIDLLPEVNEGRKNSVIIGVYSNGELIDEVKTNFLGPPKGTQIEK